MCSANGACLCLVLLDSIDYRSKFFTVTLRVEVEYLVLVGVVGTCLISHCGHAGRHLKLYSNSLDQVVAGLFVYRQVISGNFIDQVVAGKEFSMSCGRPISGTCTGYV